MNIFDTKDCEYIRTEIEKFLNEEEKEGVIQITRNDKYFIDAKITPRKRLFFYLHYGAFRFKAKTFQLSHICNSITIEIGDGDLDITRLELNGFLDKVSISVDY